MKVNNLTVNSVIRFVKENKISEIGHHHLGILMSYPSSDDYEPVILTEENLLIIGFRKHNWYCLDDFHLPPNLTININPFIKKTTIGGNEEYEIEHVEYVHELQVLYQCLSGVSLPIDKFVRKLT